MQTREGNANDEHAGVEHHLIQVEFWVKADTETEALMRLRTSLRGAYLEGNGCLYDAVDDRVLTLIR